MDSMMSCLLALVSGIKLLNNLSFFKPYNVCNIQVNCVFFCRRHGHSP